MSSESEQDFRPNEERKNKEIANSWSSLFLGRWGFATEDRIGSGQYGDVFRAYSANHQMDIAIKVIRKCQVSEGYLNKFFPRELEIIKTLRHPNVITHLQTIESKTTVCEIFELARTDLFHVISGEGGIGETKACRWFHHLVDGIDYIHKQGIVHRDLKTENLLIDHHDILRITDFGVARYCVPLSSTSGDIIDIETMKLLSTTYCGTLDYVAPEVIENTPYDPFSSDVWSTGVILYMMVFGRLPFDDSNYARQLRQMRQPVHFPNHPEVSQICKTLIQKILKPVENRINIAGIQSDKWYTIRWKKKYEIEMRNAIERQEKNYPLIITNNYYCCDSAESNEEMAPLSNWNGPTTDRPNNKKSISDQTIKARRLPQDGDEDDVLRRECSNRDNSGYRKEGEDFVNRIQGKTRSFIQQIKETIENIRNTFRARKDACVKSLDGSNKNNNQGKKKTSFTKQLSGLVHSFKRKRETQSEDTNQKDKSLSYVVKKKPRVEETVSQRIACVKSLDSWNKNNNNQDKKNTSFTKQLSGLVYSFKRKRETQSEDTNQKDKSLSYVVKKKPRVEETVSQRIDE